MKNYSTSSQNQPRDISGRFTSESAIVRQWDAERIAREERAERNRQAAEQFPGYGLEDGEILFA